MNIRISNLKSDGLNGIYNEVGISNGRPYYINEAKTGMIIYYDKYLPYSVVPSYYIVELSTIYNSIKINDMKYINFSTDVTNGVWLNLVDDLSGEKLNFDNFKIEEYIAPPLPPEPPVLDLVIFTASNDYTIQGNEFDNSTFEGEGEFIYDIPNGRVTLVNPSSLITVDCSELGMKGELDFTGCDMLEELYCYSNEITALTVSGCLSLTNLEFYENLITEIDVSRLSALSSLDASDNSLEFIDITGCIGLIFLNLSNSLCIPDGLFDCLNLQYLYFTNIPINDDFDLSLFSNLTYVGIENCGLTGITCGNSPIFQFIVKNNNITSIDLSSISSTVEDINIGFNPLSSIPDVMTFPVLSSFAVSGLGISTLNIQNKELLSIVYFDNCPNLTSVNLSGCVGISRIEGESCPLLSSINLSGINELYWININESAISSLDLSACELIRNLYANDCYSLSSIVLNPSTSALSVVEVQNCPIAELTGFTGLNTQNIIKFDAKGCALINTDNIFNAIASALPYSENGTIDVSGGTNAPVTFASDASRSFLTTGGKTWTLTYNS